VKLAYHLATGDAVAVKVISKKNILTEVARVRVELEALKDLTHQNICKLYQFIETEDTFFMILEVYICSNTSQLIRVHIYHVYFCVYRVYSRQ